MIGPSVIFVHYVTQKGFCRPAVVVSISRSWFDTTPSSREILGLTADLHVFVDPSVDDLIPFRRTVHYSTQAKPDTWHMPGEHKWGEPE